MDAYQCLLCHPAVYVAADLGNMKSHLGAPTKHNMGPYRCRRAGCAQLNNRDRPQNHGNHQARWAKDQALEGPLDRLARQCKLPWAAGVFPGALHHLAPAVQAPPAALVAPAAAQGQAPRAAPAVPAVPLAPVPAPAAPPAPPAAPANPPANVVAFAPNVGLEWMQWSREKEDGAEEPIPGYYHHFGIPYGTGPDIPGGR